MGKTLTVAQKTFTDLYDSYVLNLSSDIVAVPCDQEGKATEICTTKIIYNASTGTVDVGASCEVDDSTVPKGVKCTTSTDGEIVIEVNKDTELKDDSEMRFVFTTKNSKTFTFTRYITFIKVSKGENGENARSFQIRSEQGDTFDEGINEITMTAVAFDGLTQITNVTYKWERLVGKDWTPVLDDGSYTGDGEATNYHTEASLTVKKSDAKDNPVFKCTVTYEDKTTDEDYYQLKVMHHNYESVVKFFGGTNDISSAEPFVIAYVDLYKDHQKENALDAEYYYYHQDNVKTESGININFGKIDKSYQTDGNLVYAIYKDETVMPPVDTTSFTISTGVSPSSAGTVTGGGSYSHGANIKLTASPSDGYIFSNWADGSTENPRTVTVTNDATYTASFAIHQAEQYTITVKSNNPLHGTAHGSGTYDSGTTVTLTATANVGYVFEDWYENGVAKHWPKSINITVNSSKTITAQFRALISQDSGITATIQEDTDKIINVYKDNMVYLAFVPDSSGEYRFYSEENVPMNCYLYNANMNLLTSSSGTSTDNNFSITYNFIADQTYYFGIQINRYYYEYDAGAVVVCLKSTGVTGKYIVNLSMGVGGNSVSGSGSYNSGDMVVVTAFAKDKYEFSHWIDESSSSIISSNQSYSFSIQRDTRLMAVFKQISIPDEQTSYTITTITSPSEGGIIDGGGTYAEGTSVRLFVTENDKYKFLQWHDGNLSTDRYITVTEDQTYIAYFQPPVTITVVASPAYAGLVSGGGSYKFGNSVRLIAGAYDGYHFTRWSDGSTDVIHTVEAEYNMTYTAYFEADNTGDDDIGTTPVYYTITPSAYPSESGTVSGGGSYESGVTATLTASANSGYHFSQWDDGNTSNPRYITVTGDAAYTAYFEADAVEEQMIYEGIETSVTYENANTMKYLKFIPNHSGSYTFESLDQVSKDPDGFICNANKIQIGDCYDDSSGSDGGFSVTYDKFEANVVYYLGARLYKESGTLTVKVTYNGSSSGGSSGGGNGGGSSDSGTTSNENDFTTSDLGNGKVRVTGYSGSDTSLVIPSTIHGKSVSEIGPQAFQYNTSIQSVVLPNGIVEIYSAAFEGCTHLQSITVPATVTDIYNFAFNECGNLSTVYYAGSESQWKSMFIGTGNSELTGATIHYNSTSTYAAEPAMMMMARSPMMMAAADDDIVTYAATNNDGQRARYKSVLCQYNTSTSKWTLLEDSSNYVYRNNLYTDVLTKTIVISKEDVTNYRSIDVTVYQKVFDANGNVAFDNDLIVSNTSFTVFDINDPILNNSKPTSAKPGQLWLDTSQNPYVLYIYQNDEWTYFNQQMGKTIYTTQPDTYLVGDLWILSKAQDGYGQGTMLTAKTTVSVPGGFHISHWTDATPGTTEVINSIVESFSRDETGIKIAQKVTSSSGKVESPFYVHIDSQRMGFHSVTNNVDTEVVHIGNNSATIQNATLDGADGTKFKTDASFYNQVNIVNENSDGTVSGFAFQTEDNGSFSLILVGN